MTYIKVMPMTTVTQIVCVDDPVIEDIFPWLAERGVEGKDWAILQIRGRSINRYASSNQLGMDNTPAWMSFQFEDKDLAMLFKLTFG